MSAVLFSHVTATETSMESSIPSVPRFCDTVLPSGSVVSSPLFVSNVTVRLSGKHISLSPAPTGRDCTSMASSSFAKAAILPWVFVPPLSLPSAASTVKSTLVSTRATVVTSATPFVIFSLTFNWIQLYRIAL